MVRHMDDKPLDLRQLGYYSEPEAADLLRVKVTALRNWRCKNRGPEFTRINGRDVVYPATALRNWIQSRTVKPDRALRGTLANPRRSRRQA